MTDPTTAHIEAVARAMALLAWEAAEAEVARCRESLERLRQTCEKDYGVVAWCAVCWRPLRVGEPLCCGTGDGGESQ